MIKQTFNAITGCLHDVHFTFCFHFRLYCQLAQLSLRQLLMHVFKKKIIKSLSRASKENNGVYVCTKIGSSVTYSFYAQKTGNNFLDFLHFPGEMIERDNFACLTADTSEETKNWMMTNRSLGSSCC